jgi:hypothetical protein
MIGLQTTHHIPNQNMVVGYLNKGYPQSTIKKNKPLRKPRQKLCPQRRNKPKRSTGRLDRVPTRTRLARRAPRPPENLRLVRPWVKPVDPPHSPTLRQKSKHLMQPPTTSYPHGYSDTNMEAVPVSNLTFYCPSRNGR